MSVDELISLLDRLENILLYLDSIVKSYSDDSIIPDGIIEDQCHKEITYNAAYDFFSATYPLEFENWLSSKMHKED